MKQFSFFSLLTIFMFSCSSVNQLSKEEAAKFSMSGYDVLYDGKPVAKYENKEYEYSNGKFQFEYSFVQYSGVDLSLTPKIVRYLSTKYPGAKIEVKLQLDLEK